MKFKKGELTKEAYKVIMHDLECLELKKTKDNEYHFRLLRANLKDIFGEADSTLKCNFCKRI